MPQAIGSNIDIGELSKAIKDADNGLKNLQKTVALMFPFSHLTETGRICFQVAHYLTFIKFSILVHEQKQHLTA